MFIEKLDDAKYKDMKTTLANDFQLGNKNIYPSTIDAAIKLANN